jgi:enoyl-CoA hydratase
MPDGWAKKVEEDFTSMTYENLLLDTTEPGIQVLKINRPAVLNALNTKTLEELLVALREIAEDPKIRVLVLTGEGEKSFIAGADIAEMKDKNTSQGVGFSRLGHEVAKILEQMPKPTIAAVNGFALGGGTEMAIACDFILASENAVFGQPEVGLGIIPGFGATFRLMRFVGMPKAKELIFSGRKVKAAEALEMGLANHVYPQSELMREAIALAKQISGNSLRAVSHSKKLINEFSETKGFHYKIDSEIQEFGDLFQSFDQKEGMTAFLEKRKAHFEGLTINKED